jgi:predicted AAA+ superfamily ATPase
LARRLVAQGDFVSLDLPHVAEEAERSGAAFLGRHVRPLCVDEVQYAPALFRPLKHAIDAQRAVPAQFLLTGSQPFALMAKVAESLAGRASIVHLLPLTLAEIASTQSDALAIDDAIWSGGFPEVHAASLDPIEFFASFIVTYLERDLRSLLAVRNLRDFDRFLRMLALRVANLVDIGALAQDGGVSVNTAKSWLSVLEASGIITLVTPWFENIGKRLVKTPKVFFVDTGLACALLGLDSPKAVARSQLAGALFENLVYLEIQKALSNRGQRRAVHFYRDHAGLELDFVIPEAERLHLVEVKRAEDAPTPNAFARLAAALGSDRVASATLVTTAAVDFMRGDVHVRGPAGGAWPWLAPR